MSSIYSILNNDKSYDSRYNSQSSIKSIELDDESSFTNSMLSLLSTSQTEQTKDDELYLDNIDFSKNDKTKDFELLDNKPSSDWDILDNKTNPSAFSNISSLSDGLMLASKFANAIVAI